MRITGLLIMAGVVIIAGLVPPASAQAHDWTLWHGCRPQIGCAGSARTLDDHKDIRVCDTQKDGRRVRAWTTLLNNIFEGIEGGFHKAHTDWAPSSRCLLVENGYPLQEFNVCVEGMDCRGWYPTKWPRGSHDIDWWPFWD